MSVCIFINESQHHTKFWKTLVGMLMMISCKYVGQWSQRWLRPHTLSWLNWVHCVFYCCVYVSTATQSLVPAGSLWSVCLFPYSLMYVFPALLRAREVTVSDEWVMELNLHAKPFCFSTFAAKNILMVKDDFRKEIHSPLPPCRSCQEVLTWTGPWTCVCSSHWDRSQKAAA